MNAKEIERLLVSLKADILDEYRCTDDPDDTTPGMLVTIGADYSLNRWSYQTGDNSYTGGAYGYPLWALVYLYRRSNCRALARAAIEELKELQWGAMV